MATAFLVPKNNAESTLDGAINNSVQTLNVAAGEGSKFPSTFPFVISIGDEIIKVEARSTDTLSSLTRAQEGTSAAAHSDGATVEGRVTASQLSDIHTAIATLETFGVTASFEYTEISTPSNPAQNTVRLFARANGGSIEFVLRSSQGQEQILASLLDATPTSSNKFLLLGVKSS